MSDISKFYELMDRAEIPFISMGIPKLDEYLHGIRQGFTYLLGGDTGTGKSKFVRSVFMDNVYERVLAINDPTKLDVLFIDASLEIPLELNLAGTLTRKIFMDYQKVIPLEKLMQWRGALTQDEKTIRDSYKEYLQKYRDKLVVLDHLSPNLLHDVLLEAAKRNGTFAVEANHIDDCEGYTPNNPNLYIIVVIDTMNLVETTSEYNYLKLAMDQSSKTAVKFRNKCNFTIVEVQQFNSDIVSMDRARFGAQGPVLKDLMDSTGPSKDATVVLGLYSPMRYIKEDKKSWRGYDVETLKSWLVSIHIMKNRYGTANKYAALKFDGAVGVFEQLPEAICMTPDEYIKATRH